MALYYSSGGVTKVCLLQRRRALHPKWQKSTPPLSSPPPPLFIPPQGGGGLYKRGATEVVHDRAAVKRLTAVHATTGSSVGAARKLMDECSALKILLLCIMCLTPSASLHLRVYLKAFATHLKQATGHELCTVYHLPSHCTLPCCWGMLLCVLCTMRTCRDATLCTLCPGSLLAESWSRWNWLIKPLFSP